jgi:hypothetical protein
MVLAAVRDAAIVLLAIEALIIGALLVILLLQVRNLVRVFREEIAPVLNATKATANRVDGTVHLVSDTVVQPLIKVNSFVAGVRQAVTTLTDFKGRNIRRRR